MTASRRKTSGSPPKAQVVQGFLRPEVAALRISEQAPIGKWSELVNRIKGHAHYSDEQKQIMLTYLREAYDAHPLMLESTSFSYLILGAGLHAQMVMQKEK